MKLIEILRVLVVVIMAGALPLPVQACTFTSGALNIQANLNFNNDLYEVFDPTQVVETVSFSVTNSGTTGCNYYITATDGFSGDDLNRVLDRDGQAIDYNIYTDISLVNVLRNNDASPNSNEVIAGSFSGGGTNTHIFYVAVPPLQVVQARNSRYRDNQLFLELYEGSVGSGVITPSVSQFRTRAFVNSEVGMSLVASGGGYTIGDTSELLDFGSPTTGESLSVDVRLRTNDGYVVSMQSVNGQKMVHTNPAITSNIAYSILVDGSNHDLTSALPEQVAVGTGVTSVSGAAIPVVVTLGTILPSFQAGQYSDNIIVTVTAN